MIWVQCLGGIPMDQKKRQIKKSVSLILALVFVLLCCTLGGCKKATEAETSTAPETTAGQGTDTYAPNPSSVTEDAQTAASSEKQPATTKKAATSGGKQEAAKTTAAPEPQITGTATLTNGNKTVVYPKALESTSRRYPVIVWANGTGCPTATYMSLLEKFANAGYVVVADASVMTADGSAQRNSIDFIVSESKSASSVFYNKIDTAKIGASGHSQGGRSCVNAAQADARIQCIVSIAGASSAQEANGLKAPTLYLTGTSDMVVVSSQWVKPSYDATAGRAVYASLKGAAHTVCMTNPEKVSGYAVSWFDAYLKNDSEAKAVFAVGGKLASDADWQDYASKN